MDTYSIKAYSLNSITKRLLTAFLALLLPSCAFLFPPPPEFKLVDGTYYQSYQPQTCNIDYKVIFRGILENRSSSNSAKEFEESLMKKVLRISEISKVDSTDSFCFYETVTSSKIYWYGNDSPAYFKYYELWINPPAFADVDESVFCIGVNRTTLVVTPFNQIILPIGTPTPEGYRSGYAQNERFLPICMNTKGVRYGYLQH